MHPSLSEQGPNTKRSRATSKGRCQSARGMEGTVDDATHEQADSVFCTHAVCMRSKVSCMHTREYTTCKRALPRDHTPNTSCLL